MAILGIVVLCFVVLCIPRISTHGPRSRVTAAYTDINGAFHFALRQYRVDTGSYPKSLQGLLRQPDGATNWRGPYLDKIPVDPWGNDYHYELPGRRSMDGYDLFSAGPDGRVGTADDIGNWTK